LKDETRKKLVWTKEKKTKQIKANIFNLVKSLKLAIPETLDLGPIKKFFTNQFKNMNFKNLSKKKNNNKKNEN